MVAVHRSRDKAPQPAAGTIEPATQPGAGAPTIEVGRVARPHGVRGELRVQLHWPDSDSLLTASEISLGLPGSQARVMQVEGARRADRAILIKLAEVADRDAAAALRGATVSVARSDLPAADEGEFYLCDLIGAQVVEPGGPVGVVVEIRGHPSVDCLVIRTEQGKTLEQPLVAPWFERVDLDAHCIYLSGRDGLIE